LSGKKEFMLARNIPAALLVVTALLPAADFWAVREPSQWSQQEIKRMVTDSPWAKDAHVTVMGDSGAMVDGAKRNQRGSMDGDPPFSGSGARSDMGGGRDRLDGGVAVSGAPVVPHLVVRWESALPVTEACAKGGLEKDLFSCTSKLFYLSGLSSKFEDLSKEFYIVSVSSYPKMLAPRLAQEAPQHSAGATAALEQMGQHIQQRTVIKRNGKSPFKPARVIVLPAGRGLLLMMLFHRSEALTVDDKEVLFELKDETIEVESRFNLRKMVYNGQLQL
jgi:hypothetical protein